MDNPLTKLIQEIQQKWAMLKNNWSNHLLSELYSDAQKLEQLSETHSETAINEASFSFEVYLSTFSDINICPDNSQLQKIEDLLSDIVQLQGALASTDEEEYTKEFIAYFGEPDFIPSDFIAYCDKHHFIFRIFQDPATLSIALSTMSATALLVDARSAKDIKQVISDIVSSPRSNRTIITLMSSNDNISSRLVAKQMKIPRFIVAPKDSKTLFNTLKAEQHFNNDYYILVVEDDPAQADFVAAVLSSANYHVKTVTDPLSTFDIADAYVPDLFIIDLHMPGINGNEVAAILRDKPEHQSTPILMLSGSQESKLKKQALQHGINEFIEKPVRPQELFSTVGKYLKQKSKAVHNVSQRAHQTVHASIEKIISNPDDSSTYAVIYLTLSSVNIANQLMEIVDPHALALEINGKDLVGVLKSSSNTKLSAAAEHISMICQQRMKELVEGTESCNVGLCLLDENLDAPTGLICKAKYAAEHLGGRCNIGTYCSATDDVQMRNHQDAKLLEQQLQQQLSKPFQIIIRPIQRMENQRIVAEAIWPGLQLHEKSQWKARDIANAPLSQDIQLKLDQHMLNAALDRLQQHHNEGKHLSIILPLSTYSMTDESFKSHLLTQLRRRHQVGTGLIFEYKLSQTARLPQEFRQWFTTLLEMDIHTAINGMSAKETALKLALFLSPKFVSFNLPATSSAQQVAKACKILRSKAIFSIINLSKGENIPEKTVNTDYFLQT